VSRNCDVSTKTFVITVLFVIAVVCTIQISRAANTPQGSNMHPLNSEFYYLQAKTLAEAGDFHGAVTELTKAIKLKPDNSEAYCKRGIMFLNLTDPMQALSDLDEAAKLEPNDAFIHLNRGKALAMMGRGQDALAELDRAKTLGLGTDYISDFYFIRGLAHQLLSDWHEAVDDFGQAIKLNPNNAYAYLNRGNILIGLDDLQQGITDLDQGIRLSPDLCKAYLDRACAHTTLGHPQEALADLDKAIRLGYAPDKTTDGEFYFARGNARFDLNDWEGAMTDYSQVIKLDPMSPLGWFKRGLTRGWKLGDSKGAILDFNEAIRLQPDFWEAYQDRANAKDSLGDKIGTWADDTQASLIQLRLSLCKLLGIPQVPVNIRYLR
jgi:tetratricopeptide (TPR) repeat protein